MSSSSTFHASRPAASLALRLACICGFALLALPGSALADVETDRKIERAAQSSYNFRAILNNQVQVAANDGSVTLTGVVRDQQQKSLAEVTVRELPGVISVENKLETSSPMHERADGWIALKINGLLFLRSQVSARQTDVTVQDGIVTLRGIAETPEQKLLTESIASGVEGVKSVRNEMQVRHATERATDTLADDAPAQQQQLPHEAASAAAPSAASPVSAAPIDDRLLAVRVKHTLVEGGARDGLEAQIESRQGRVVIRGLARSESEKATISQLARSVPGVAAVANEMNVGASE
jgi:osmotically-inducible protein OsmY